MSDVFPVPNDWPFADPPGTEVITLERILDGRAPVLLVTHDEDEEEASWQFLDGEQVFEDDASIVLLGEIVQFDPSLIELADLPRGWLARRSAPGQPWVRTLEEPSYRGFRLDCTRRPVQEPPCIPPEYRGDVGHSPCNQGELEGVLPSAGAIHDRRLSVERVPPNSKPR